MHLHSIIAYGMHVMLTQLLLRQPVTSFFAPPLSQDLPHRPRTSLPLRLSPGSPPLSQIPLVRCPRRRLAYARWTLQQCDASEGVALGCVLARRASPHGHA